jgi:hypothetical protein
MHAFAIFTPYTFAARKAAYVNVLRATLSFGFLFGGCYQFIVVYKLHTTYAKWVLAGQNWLRLTSAYAGLFRSAPRLLCVKLDFNISIPNSFTHGCLGPAPKSKQPDSRLHPFGCCML